MRSVEITCPTIIDAFGWQAPGSVCSRKRVWSSLLLSNLQGSFSAENGFKTLGCRPRWVVWIGVLEVDGVGFRATLYDNQLQKISHQSRSTLQGVVASLHPHSDINPIPTNHKWVLEIHGVRRFPPTGNTEKP